MSAADPSLPCLAQRRLVFSHVVPAVGLFSLSPLCAADMPLLHQWVTQERARFWGLLQASEDEVRQCYQQQIDSPHHAPYLGFFGEKPAFLLESYDPAHDELAEHYAVQPGDCGMHVLIGPAGGVPIHGFSRAVMQTILAFLFSQPAVRRVVVEPDVRNERIHPLNRAFGFDYLHTVQLRSKTAWLATCTPALFQHALETAHKSPQEMTV